MTNLERSILINEIADSVERYAHRLDTAYGSEIHDEYRLGQRRATHDVAKMIRDFDGEVFQKFLDERKTTHA